MYLERLLTIVETIAATGRTGAMTVAEIATETGVPKPSLYRQVNDLVDAGLLEPRANGRYAVGVRALRLSGQLASRDDVKNLAAPLLRRAARDHDVAFFLARLSGASVDIFHAEVPTTGVSYLHPGIGARPLHACSCAKAMAAFSEDKNVEKALSGRLRAYTQHTKVSLVDIQSEFQTIKAKGYAECVEEVEMGVCSVAVPLRIRGQPIQYSLGATGTLRVFSASFRNALGNSLITISKDLSDQIKENQVDPIGLAS